MNLKDWFSQQIAIAFDTEYRRLAEQLRSGERKAA